MTGLNDAEHEEPAATPQTARDEAVLGPVAAKGPKRFDAMPDLSKIPESARARLAQFAQGGVEWGASSTDARSLSVTQNEDDVSLDLSPLGVPTPHNPAPQIPSTDVDAMSAPLPSALESAVLTGAVDLDDSSPRPAVSDFSGEEYLEDEDEDFEEPETPDSAPSAASALDSDSPANFLDADSPANALGAVAVLDTASVPTAQSSNEAANANTPSLEKANKEPVLSVWSDGIPLPDEPEPYWEDFMFEGDLSDLAAPASQSPVSAGAARSERDDASVAASSPTYASHAPEASAQPRSREVSDSELRAQAEAHLRRLVGREDATLREDQWTAISALVKDRSRALVVQRTGWGKSAVYFVATLLLRAQGDGPTIIISPLLALMRDQIAAAERAGIKAATINSANITEWDAIHSKINAGEIDVLLCSPERLNNPSFRDEVLPRLAQDAGLVVVDEAHCISDWGHDFRPDYRRIKTLLEELQPGIPVLATTATANERVSTDIAEQLAVTARGGLENVTVLRGGLDRESLHLAVVQLPTTTHRIAWITDALSHLDGSGIVYCMTVSAAQEVTEQLRAAGLNVAAYTGRTDPDERAQLELQLKNNEVKALIATSALGMGFDKPDLTFVIHLGAPNSPIAYYQQVGRAGRGVAQASAILLPGKEDREIWEYFGSLAFPPETQVREVIHLLEAARSNGMGPVTVPQLESKVDLKRSRLETMLKVLDVDGAVRRVQGGWTATGVQWSYDSGRYRRVEAARQAEQNAMLAYASSKDCRIKFLRASLDDPSLDANFRCGRCDNCGGITLPSVVSSSALEQTNAHNSKPGIELPARKMWPANMPSLGIEVKGKIQPAEQSADGRAIARIDGLGWSNDLRELFAPGTPDGLTPVRLRMAAAQVLDTWADARECEGVISIRSLSRPTLVAHLATGLAQYLKIPYIGEVGPRNDMPAPRHDINSAMRLAGVARRLGVELSPQAAAGLTGRTVLLVDDFADSGWTIAVASRLLRQAGAAKVVPFVLAQS